MQIKRFSEIDIFRGIAVILMVIFHFGYNLNFFGLISINPSSGIWLVLARIVQFTFILSTGITLYISYHRDLKKSKKMVFLLRLRHSGKLFFFAMLITLVTWILYREQAVKFGILHFYSVAILFGLPFLRLKYFLPILAIVLLVLSPYITSFTTDSSVLFPIGITNHSFQSLDYFPLFPWFGWFLIGISLGHIFYPEGRARFVFGKVLDFEGLKPLRFIGEKSLHLYLLHQPILAALILLYIQTVKA